MVEAETSAEHPFGRGSGYRDGIYYSKRPEQPIPSDWRLDVTTHILDHPHLDWVALVDSTTGASCTYRDLKQRVYSLATGLASVGVKQGDVVMILSPNSVHFPAVALAICAIGAVTTSINPASTTFEISNQVKDSKASFIITVPEHLEKVASLTKKLIVIDGFGDESIAHKHVDPRVIGFLSDLYKADPNMAPRVRIRQTDTAFLLYSSGTTGLSKGVKLSHRNCLAAVSAGPDFAAVVELQRTFLVVIPFYHVFGMVPILLTQLQKGSKIVAMPKFDFPLFLAAIERYQATHLPVVPPILVLMAKSPLVQKFNMSSLELIGVGGAPIGPEVLSTCSERFQGVTLRAGFGLTETGGACSSTIPFPNGADYYASVGMLLANVEAMIVELGSGESLPPCQTGELWLRGPMVMQGYLNNEKATAETLDKEGWLHTGDLAYFDDDGYLYIVDRIKELIKYNGYQVAPAELEAILLSHPEILDAGVTGFPDERSGQIPVAFVVKDKDSRLIENDVMNFVAEKVSPYKRVRKVVFMETIPKSPSGKILRRYLKVPPASKL